MPEKVDAKTYAGQSELNRRWEMYIKNRNINVIENVEDYFGDFLRSDIHGFIELTTDPNAQTYLDALKNILNRGPARGFGILKEKLEIRRIESEIKKNKIDAFPSSTLYKMASTIGLGLVTAMTTILTLTYDKIIESDMIYIAGTMIVGGYITGIFVIFWSMSKLSSNEDERSKLFKEEFEV